MAGSQTGGRFCLEKWASSLLQRELFYQLQYRDTNGHHPWDFRGVKVRGMMEVKSITSIQHSVGGHSQLTSFLSPFQEVIWVLQARVASKRLYSARIKFCCLSSAPSLLSLFPSIKLETGTTIHLQCACAHLCLDLEMGSFEFHRFPKRGPIQKVSSERN